MNNNYFYSNFYESDTFIEFDIVNRFDGIRVKRIKLNLDDALIIDSALGFYKAFSGMMKEAMNKV